MRSQWTGFHSPLADGLQAFLAHKRALWCRFRTEEMSLRLLDRFLIEQQVTTVDAISPALVDAFLASRKRTSPQSYNHLLWTVARSFQWLADRDLAPPLSHPCETEARHTIPATVPLRSRRRAAVA